AGPEVPVPEAGGLVRLPPDVTELLRRLDGGGRMGVVEQRRGADEALVPHQLLGVEPAVGPPEDGVALPGHLAQEVVDRHGQRFPRAACSRSMASKSALKLPLPKLLAPFRWMIS